MNKKTIGATLVVAQIRCFTRRRPILRAAAVAWLWVVALWATARGLISGATRHLIWATTRVAPTVLFVCLVTPVHAADLVADLIADSVTVVLGETLNTNGYDIDSAGDITITGTLDATDDVEGDTTYIYVGGSWSATGTFTADDSTVLFDGTGAETITPSGQSFYNITINDGLLGYWKMEETANNACPTALADACDSSGYHRDMTVAGNTAVSSTVPDLQFATARSRYFDGNGDYMSVSYSRSSAVLQDNTLAAWVRIDGANTAGSEQGVVVIMNSGDNSQNQILINTTADGFTCSSFLDTDHASTSTVSISQGEWIFIACVFDATGANMTATSYLNGVQVATESGSGAYQYDATVMKIGVQKVGAFLRYLNGYVDEARIYNRALSATEIAALARGGFPATSASGASVTLADALDIDGDLVINSGDLNNSAANDYAITVAGSWMNNGGKFTNDGGTVTFNGTSGTHSIQAGNEDFNILQVNGSGGTWNLVQDVMITDDLDIDAGTLDTNGYDLVITDDMDIDANLDLASGYHSVMGSVDFTGGTITEDVSTLVLNPATAGETLTAASETLAHLALTSTDGLIGWWKLDEAAFDTCNGGLDDFCDSSGNGNHGDEEGTPTMSVDTAPVDFSNPRAIELDEVNDKVLINMVSGLPIYSVTSAYSVALWVRPDNLDSEQCIFHEGQNNARFVIQSRAGNDVHIWLPSGASPQTIDSTTTLSDGKWHHIVWTDEAGDGHLFINGSEDAADFSYTPGAQTTATRLVLGACSSSATAEYALLDGRLDDIRVYNRRLTEEEVVALYRGHPLSATGTITLQDALDIDGDMVLGDGTFAAGANTITVASDWTNSAATFTYGTSTVDFDDDAQNNTITGDTTFYNLTVSTAAAKTVSFESGSTTSIADNGTLTLTGAASQLLTLSPGTSATDWDLTVSSTGTTQSVDYVSVSHSDASGGATIDADSGNNVDGGGTANWDFNSGTTTLYRSVGVTATDLNTGAATVTISASTATFSAAMPDGIGVGDALVYSSGGQNRLAFIHGRTSSTIYTVKDKNGNTPASAAAGTAVSIYRSYASLADWESQTENANITEPVEDDVNPDLDLVAADTIMQVACYADGQDTAQVSISGWTTGASNYIRVYTPVSSSEVGATQRHSGVWNSSAYNLTYTGNGNTLGVATPYVRIEGLQIMWDGNNINNYALLLSYAGTVGMYVSDTIITKNGTESGTAGLVVGSGITGGDLFVSNNVIYGFSDSGNRCVYIVDADSAMYFYNNTIYDCETGVSGNGSTRAKNVIVQSSTDGYSGSLHAASTHNISDIAGDAPGSNPRHCAVSFQDAGNADLRLASGDTCAVNSGTDLSADGSLAISDDIIGTSRPTGAAFDIGAYEVSDPDTRNFYRSVGTTATDLNVDTRTVTIEDGTATFSGAMPDIVGVGDTLEYTDEAGGAQLAFITARTSSTVYSVRDKLGSEPAYANANAVSVYRAYASLADWESQTENTNITEPAENDVNPDLDLVTADYIYNVATYADGADTTAVTINGWTTGAANYIRVYTPVSTSEVGTSQRHSGVWDTGAYYRSGLDAGINIAEEYVHIDGLQIELDGGNGYAALYMNFSASPAIEISNNILQESSADSNTGNDGIRILDDFAGGTIKIWNNICYGFDDANDSCYSYFDNQVSTYFYNNIAYGCTMGFEETAFSDSMYLKNNIVQSCSTGYSGTFRSSSTNNVSDDATAPHANPRHCNVAFVDAGNDDFRLASSDTCAVNSGADLSADGNLAISDDITGTSRPAGAAFDIGAYEVSDPDTRNFYRSVGTTATDLNVDGRTVTIEDGAATFSGAMPDIVGVGDTLAYTDETGGAQLAFVTGRTSSTVYTVRDKLGSEPAYASANAVNVYRAYNSLANWEAQTENANITEPVENDVNPSTDLTVADAIMQVACYGDGVDTAAVNIDGWTTGVNNYIRIYVPKATNEVGASQRHSGVWDTGAYYMEVNDSVLATTVAYVRLEGLQINKNGSGGAYAVHINTADTGTAHILESIVRGTGGSETGIMLQASNVTAYVANNIVYDFTTSSNGIRAYQTAGAYFYNNTVHNSGDCFEGGATTVLKNNVTKGCLTNSYNGTFSAASTHNIADDGTAVGSSPRHCDVAFADETNDDFRLASADICAVNSGEDLSADGSLAVSDDVVGTSRPAGAAYDIGAYEVTDPDTRSFYRSVGTTATDLNVDARTVTIEDGTATFSGAMPDIVGVGDTLVYSDEAGGAQLAFITGRTSSTVYSIRGTLGSEPAYANANAVSVYRAYNSLANWESQTENTNITEPTEDDVNPDLDLVTADYVMQVACFADGTDTDALTISGWTTGSSNYIRVFTPVSAGEVGSSQRHSGVWSASAYNMDLDSAGNGITVNEGYVRLEGLQIDYNGNNSVAAISVGATETVAVYISHNIIREDSADANTANKAVDINSDVTGGNVYAYNNIAYNFNDAGDICFRDRDFSSNSYYYNNTAYNCDIGYSDESAATRMRSKNNIAHGGSNGFSGGFNAVSTNNVSDIAGDAPGSAPRVCNVQFVDPGAADFRLAGTDVCANNAGTDLSADANLPFSDDITGTTRGVWDAGAHEQSAGGNISGIDLGHIF